MPKQHLILFAAVAIFSVILFGINLKFSKANRQLKTQLNSLVAQQQSVSSPNAGWVMPMFKSKRIDGSDGTINLQHSAFKMTLLLFDPINCVTCEQNWRFWSKLLSDPDSRNRFIFVTGANSISPEYSTNHALDHQLVRMAVDSGILKQMRMQAAPQTIYMEGGTVKKVWFGLLSDDDVAEIGKEMKTDD